MEYGPYYTAEDGRTYRNIDVQPNKGTKNPKVASIAKADSHQVLCTIAVPTDNPPTKSEFAAMLADKLGYDLVFILVLLL